jgi:hypothetical protein
VYTYGTICSTDVLECPDGSFMARESPGCEHAACPQALAFTVDSGECVAEGSCVRSPNHPETYEHSDACAIAPVQPARPLEVRAFHVRPSRSNSRNYTPPS